MLNARFSVASLLVTLALAAPAEAALIRVDFTGINSSPASINVWGTPVPSLSGYLVYDSDAPASSTTGTTATNYANAIKELGFSLGSTATAFSGSRLGSFGSVQVRDAAGADALSFNSILLGASELTGVVPTLVNGTATRTFNNAQLTLNLQGPASVLSSQALFGPFDPALFSNQKQLQVFLSYTQQPGGTTSGSWPAVSYNYNLDSIRTTVVPLPAAGLLWLSAAGLLAGIRRRAGTA